jgi:exodeoxyribonuclease VIII
VNIDIMHDMPAADYHEAKALSKSGLDQFRKSPAHFRSWQDGKTRNESSPALEFGTAAHCAVLEPERFILTYRMFTGDRRTKQGKEDHQLIIDNGQIPLPQDQ